MAYFVIGSEISLISALSACIWMIAVRTASSTSGSSPSAKNSSGTPTFIPRRFSFSAFV